MRWVDSILKDTCLLSQHLLSETMSLAFIRLLYPMQHQSYGPGNRPQAQTRPWGQGWSQYHQSYRTGIPNPWFWIVSKQHHLGCWWKVSKTSKILKVCIIVWLPSFIWENLPWAECFCVPPKKYTLKPNPQCDGVWRWGLWEVIRVWVRS